MSTIASMAVELTADTGKFQKDIENSTEDVEEFEDSTESASSSLDGFIGVAKKAGVGLVGLAGSIAETVRRSSNFAKEMEMMAGAADVSVESFQELNFAFNQMNLDTDDVSEALVEVNRVMGEATRGEVDMQRRLEDLGFTMSELSELGTEEAFVRMVDELANMESQAEKTAISGKLFGEDVSRRLLPAIEDGSAGLEEMREQAEELGIVMDRDTIRRFSNFRDEFRATRAALFNGVRMFSAQFLPVMIRINDRVQDMTGWFANLDDATRQNIAQWTLLVGGMLAFVTTAGLLAKTIQLVISGFAFLKVSIAAILGLFSSLAMYILLPIATLGLLYTAWEEDWLGMRSIITKAYDEHIKPSIDKIVNKLDELKEWFLDTEIGQMVSDFWNDLTTVWEDEESSFSSKMSETIDVAIDFSVKIGNWIWERTEEAYSNLAELIEAAWDYLAKDDTDAFKDLEISLGDVAIVGISFAAAMKATTILSGIGTALAAAAPGLTFASVSAAGALKFSLTASVVIGLTVAFNIISDNWDKITAKIQSMTTAGMDFAADPTGITGGLNDMFPDYDPADPLGLTGFLENQFPDFNILDMLDSNNDYKPPSKDDYNPYSNEYAMGGLVSGPGSGTSDSIMARISDGEFVVNAKATEQFLPLLKAINSGKMPSFQNGGLVGRASSSIGGLFADSGFQDQIGSMDNMINSVSEGFEDLLEGIKTVVEMIFDGIMLMSETMLGEKRVKEIRERFEEIKESATEAIDGLFDFSNDIEEINRENKTKEEISIFQKLINQANEAVKNINWAQGINNTIEKVGKELEKSTNMLESIIGNFVSAIDFEMSDGLKLDIGSTVQSMTTNLMDLVGNAVTELFEDKDYGSPRGESQFPDIQQMHKNFQNFEKNQRRINEIQDKIAGKTVGGAAGGAMVGFGVGGPIGGLIGGLAGGLFGKSSAEKEYEALRKELESRMDTLQDVKEALETTVSNVASGLSEAFSAETYQGFVNDFGSSIEQMTRQALVKAFMSSEAIKPLLTQLSDAITAAVVDGTISAQERETITDLYKEITDKSSDFYKTLQDLNIAGEKAADSTEKLSEAMRNVPQMLPTQQIRQDITAGDIPSAQVGAEVTRSGMVNVHAGETITPGGKGNNQRPIIIQGDVYGWRDFKRKVNEAFDQTETNKRLASQGSTGRGVR